LYRNDSSLFRIEFFVSLCCVGAALASGPFRLLHPLPRRLPAGAAGNCTPKMMKSNAVRVAARYPIGNRAAARTIRRSFFRIESNDSRIESTLSLDDATADDRKHRPAMDAGFLLEKQATNLNTTTTILSHTCEMG